MTKPLSDKMDSWPGKVEITIIVPPGVKVTIGKDGPHAAAWPKGQGMPLWYRDSELNKEL